jgi:hypothetical protein
VIAFWARLLLSIDQFDTIAQDTRRCARPSIHDNTIGFMK